MLVDVAEEVPEVRDDVRMRQELVGAEQVVEVFDLVRKLRNQEYRIGRVRHVDSRSHQKSGFDFVVVLRQFGKQDL